MNNEIIISPCISICKIDPITDCCYGCGRTNEEIKNWKDEKTSDEWKNENLKDIQNRMSEWQLETFKESYLNKKKKKINLDHLS